MLRMEAGSRIIAPRLTATAKAHSQVLPTKTQASKEREEKETTTMSLTSSKPGVNC